LVGQIGGLLCVKDLDACRDDLRWQIIDKVDVGGGEGMINHKGVEVTAGKNNDLTTKGGEVSREGVAKVTFISSKIDVAKTG
jgi:hypothetical protein